MCRRPQAGDDADAVAWLCREVSPLASIEGVQDVRVVQLERASARWPQSGDFLVEVDLSPDAAPLTVIDAQAGMELLGDMQLLGMAPSVAVLRRDRTVSV